VAKTRITDCADTEKKNQRMRMKKIKKSRKTRKTDFFPKKLRKRIKSEKKLADAENLAKSGSKIFFTENKKKNCDFRF
jgi:hypothetical protein